MPVLRLFARTTMRMGTPANLKCCRMALLRNFWLRSDSEAAVVKTAKVGGRAFTWGGRKQRWDESKTELSTGRK